MAGRIKLIFGIKLFVELSYTVLLGNSGTFKLHTFQLLLFVHKVIHHPEKLPEAFPDYFEINSTFHGHHTRSTNKIHIFRVNTCFGKRALCYKTACMWNDLPAKFKCLKSTNLFKRKIKMYLAHH